MAFTSNFCRSLLATSRLASTKTFSVRTGDNFEDSKSTFFVKRDFLLKDFVVEHLINRLQSSTLFNS